MEIMDNGNKIMEKNGKNCGEQHIKSAQMSGALANFGVWRCWMSVLDVGGLDELKQLL
ncbi:MAG: hypothetical protein OCU22_00160 [Canidatus Methanoxibalbensis ujae]|nr:hypothetical protein [Candidatus Methanoxibalbensis ujae]